jgi:hypothetical protein
VSNLGSETFGLGIIGFKNKNNIDREVLVKRTILGIIVLPGMLSS